MKFDAETVCVARYDGSLGRWTPPVNSQFSFYLLHQQEEWAAFIYLYIHTYTHTKTKLNSVALVRERTIPTERPPPVGEVSANFCG